MRLSSSFPLSYKLISVNFRLAAGGASALLRLFIMIHIPNFLKQRWKAGVGYQSSYAVAYFW